MLGSTPGELEGRSSKVVAHERFKASVSSECLSGRAAARGLLSCALQYHIFSFPPPSSHHQPHRHHRRYLFCFAIMASPSEGSSCGQWPPKAPGSFMTTSAVPLQTDLPAPRGLQTEIMLEPPQLPYDSSYQPLAPPATEMSRAKGDVKHHLPDVRGPRLRPRGWVPEVIHTALTDLGYLPSGVLCASTPGSSTPPNDTSCSHTQKTTNNGKEDEPNVLWRDLESVLVQPSGRKGQLRRSSRRPISIPPLGSSAAAGQGPATRSRVAAEAARATQAPKQIGDQASPTMSAEERIPNGFCDACHTPGSLICCDDCERSFHFTCLNPPWDLEKLPAGMDHDAPWSCNMCHARKAGHRPRNKGSSRLLQPVLTCIQNQNPREFHLPSELQRYFKGVEADAGGTYVDTSMVLPWKHVTVKATKLMVSQEREPFRLRNKNGLILCFRCGKSALPSTSSAHYDECSTGSKGLLSFSTLEHGTACGEDPPGSAMLSCDFCPLHWHVDCLDPPLMKFPSNSCKWRCPAHTEHIQTPSRQPRTASLTRVVDFPDTRRDEARDTQHGLTPCLSPGLAQGAEYVRYKVPEHVIQRRFWDGINHGNETFQAYAVQQAHRAKHGKVTLTEPGQVYRLSVPRNLTPRPHVQIKQGPLAVDLQRIMTVCIISFTGLILARTFTPHVLTDHLLNSLTTSPCHTLRR